MDFGRTVRHTQHTSSMHIGAEDKEQSSEGGSLSDLKPAKPKCQEYYLDSATKASQPA